MAAFLVGVPLAFAGLVGGLILTGAMIFIAVLVGLTYGRIAFAGLAIGLGMTWATMLLLAAFNCAAPGQPCGATPIDLTPHIVLSLALAAVGAVVALAPSRIQ